MDDAKANRKIAALVVMLISAGVLPSIISTVLRDIDEGKDLQLDEYSDVLRQVLPEGGAG